MKVVLDTNDLTMLVDTFLGWKLPHTFAPDCGVYFDRSKLHITSWPTGTNILTADEAKAMFTALLESLPQQFDAEPAPEVTYSGHVDSLRKANGVIVADIQMEVGRVYLDDKKLTVAVPTADVKHFLPGTSVHLTLSTARKS